MSLLSTVTFEDAHGHATLSGGGGVVKVEAVGRYSLVLSQQVVERVEKSLAHGRVWLFVDFSNLSRYDSEARAHATAWCQEHLHRLSALNILSRPGLVAMGVATAAMTLSIAGLRVTAHTDETKFFEALANATSMRSQKSA